MADKEPSQKQLIADTHDKVVQLSTLIIGVPGTEDGGLCSDMKDTKTELRMMNGSVKNLSRRVWIVIGILIGVAAVFGPELPTLARMVLGGF